MSGRARGFAVVVMLGGLSIGVATASLVPGPAQAQSADSSSGEIQNQPLAPPPGTNENTLIAPNTAGPDSANPGAPAAPEASSSAGAPSVAAPSQWVPQQQAQLTVLDKIYGISSTMSAKVGVPFSIRFLTVTVLACWTRPPALPPDAAAYLQVTDSHAAPGSPPEFRGWIFKAEPALSNMDDPATDISVDGCG